MPIVRLDSITDDAEEHIIEVEDFSKLDDSQHKQMGLMPSSKEVSFAQAVLKTHSSTEGLSK